MKITLYETAQSPTPPHPSAKRVGKNRWRLPNASYTINPVTPTGWITAHIQNPEPFSVFAPNQHPDGPQRATENRKLGGYTAVIPNIMPGDTFLISDDKEWIEHQITASTDGKTLQVQENGHGNITPIPATA